MKSRHFPYQHPTFGTKANPKPQRFWLRSVYYWWFEYLRRNEAYKKTCLNKGRGKLANLYDDFGDVFKADFKTWWITDERGAVLFSEQLVKDTFEVVNFSDISSANKNILYVKIPLHLPKRFLKAKFHELLKKLHEGKRGIRQARQSKAKYIVIGQPNIEALKKTLKVYDYHLENPHLKLWEIGKNLRLSLSDNPLHTDSSKIAYDKRNRLSASVSRYLRKAKRMIENTSKGRFPDIK
jgi:hypothetical protein